ncbi:hypothetical protein tb265_03350 [Gemmatimonadetes bacterium T265]|nr:hypothetical protein tb265_03350 [Gemmatimonadetes bacterium T265]
MPPEVVTAGTSVRVAACAFSAAVALAVDACARGPAPRTAVEQAAALTPEIEQAVGLRFRTPPRIERRSRAAVHDVVAATLATPEARAQLAAQQLAYRRLGLIPDTLDLAALTARTLDEQVAGYYDPRSKTLYLVDGIDSAATAATLRHEMVHALQDQHLNLDSILTHPGNADADAAARAALEGQAMWVQLGGGRDIASRLPGGWDRVRQEIRANADRSPQLSTAPLVVREGLLFPYLSGAELARQAAAAGRLDTLAVRLPTSTRQVLHPEVYLAARPAGQGGAAPRLVTVTLPPPRSGTATTSNTLGEFDTRLFLYQQSNDLGGAARAAAGLAGDRWSAVRTGGGEAFVWLTVWDSGVDAAEFYQAARDAVAKRYEGARADSSAGAAGAGNVTTFTSSARDGGRVVRLRALDVQGRPAVLYADAPSAGELDVVDATRATVRP